MTLDNNFKLAENAVLSVEESLSKVFQERSNHVFQKLENILTIFKEEKVLFSSFFFKFSTFLFLAELFINLSFFSERFLFFEL